LQIAGTSAGPDDEGLAVLSVWAVEARYPGDLPDASSSDARQAVAAAGSVVEAARVSFERPTTP
jgi:hypothetical protein